jgi:NADH dehydrogenase
MILVTGGTGFIGSVLVRRLAAEGHPVRLLIRPSTVSPKIPHHIPVEVAVSSLNDERGLKAAMKDVNFIFHLAGAERMGSRADLEGVDVQGTSGLVKAIDPSRVRRFFYISHIGADRASAYPVMKAKAIAEGFIKQSQLPYTIFRSAAVFGEGDQFTSTFVKLAKRIPFFFFIPGNGSALLQPLWVDDLVTCLMIALEDDKTKNQCIEVGGMESISYRKIMEIILRASGIHRRITSFSTPILRSMALNLEQNTRRFPLSIFWLDYLATDHTCELDSVSHRFGLIPSRFEKSLDYLKSNPKKK